MEEFVKEVLKQIKRSLEFVKMFLEKENDKIDITYHLNLLNKIVEVFPPIWKLNSFIDK